MENRLHLGLQAQVGDRLRDPVSNRGASDSKVCRGSLAGPAQTPRSTPSSTPAAPLLSLTLSALARKFADVFVGQAALVAGASSRWARRSRSWRVNFHWNGAAICS